MALFKKNTQAEEGTDQIPHNPSNVIIFRLLAVAYVGYLCIQMVKTYMNGGPGAPSLPLLIGSLVLLGGGAIFLGILSYRDWTRNKRKYDEAMAAIKAEAKAAREAEEALEAQKKAEDEYYEMLEASETAEPDE